MLFFSAWYSSKIKKCLTDVSYIYTHTHTHTVLNKFNRPPAKFIRPHKYFRILSKTCLKNNIYFHREVHHFLVKILYWQCKRWALCKVSSSTSQRLSMNLMSGLRGANSCVKMILHAPSQQFFHNLSLMNLHIVILEYGHDSS